ncbi:hypothetical protein [Delftia acidovorans]|uniref:hypothetical protein n=1 Tax=Delftia acidovorans TaxID=80866 RepID=UPI0022AB74ED|nr:hypothetical protein [Delftia acidovorans]WAT87629.1 hypothetical protein O1V13_10415 [Delftia acidovorans]
MHLSRKAVFLHSHATASSQMRRAMQKARCGAGFFSGNVDDGSYATIVLRQNVSAAVTVVFFVVVHDAPA